jgi:hypothetical protein
MAEYTSQQTKRPQQRNPKTMSDQAKYTSGKNPLLDEVLRLTRMHFDDDAPEYIIRFLKAHLQKPPELLTADDLVSLVHWISIFATFLDDSEGAADRYIAAILELVPSDIVT